MKKVILLFLFMPFPAFGQIMENFESGNLNGWVQGTDGHWIADTTSSISGRYSLRHSFDNPDTGTDQIGMQINDLKPSMGITKWSFMIRHGYDPSAANNWCVFLISDREPAVMVPEGNINGFTIGVNLTGYDDTLRLLKIKNGIISQVLNTGVNWQNNIGSDSAAIIDVERSQTGLWKVNILSSSGSGISSAEATDSELFNIRWFGLYYRYTSTRDRLLWLDNLTIDGVFVKDIMPPEVADCKPVARNSIEISLNEEPDDDFISLVNFSANSPTKTANNIIKLYPFSYRITFDNVFLNRTINNLVINRLCDKDSNCTYNISIPFTPVWAERGDVIISEVMADPIPSVSLPEKEYLEITNKSEFSFSLKNWKLSSEGQSSLFPGIIITPGEYLIVCSVTDTSYFHRYGRVAGVKSFPSLTDANKCIVLSDSSDNMIHGVEYSSDWYGDQLKSEGGWSLEMIDKNYPFYMSGNWTASLSNTGGTPGKRNSAEGENPDRSFIGLVNVFPTNNTSIEVSFSEPVKDIENFLPEVKVGEMNIKSLVSSDPLLRKFVIKFDITLKRNQQYTITFPSSLTDFSDNKIEKESFCFGLPEPVSTGDILFNEILFNPLPGDQDYIELYNASEKVINASDLYFVSVSSESGDTSELVPVSGENRCILPGAFYAVTTDREAVIRRYFTCVPANIFQTGQLPSMPDDKGHLILLNRQLGLIDEVSYDEKMHYSLLSGYEGIALEKLRPASLSSDWNNWHSASEASGWGTPGASNSVYSSQPVSEENVVLSSTKITPDNDGIEDFLVIDLKLQGNGNVVAVLLYDETGNFIRKLTDNLLAGNQATVTWDGTGEDGSLVSTGIYIIYISVFDDAGKSKRWKKVCTVVR
jgi:hypothetical protein